MNKAPSLFKNLVSFIGLFLTGVATVIGLPMVFIDLFSSHTNPYAGILTYLILPSISVFGVMVALAGVLWERHRRKKHPEAALTLFPIIDLNNYKHRRILVGSTASVVVIIVLLAMTGYQAYQFSESVEFCGLTCHSVMKPEYTAYQFSPHARVACAGCHIGSGANYFVKSKITGAYQIYSVLFHKYSRPIETPVKNLRPAQGTCEQCHWPAKFFGSQQKTFVHVLTDEKNTQWKIQTLLKIGGGDPLLGASGGIHWHMNIKNKIYYVDSDGKREVIPYVKSVHPDGTVTEYMSTENPLTAEQLSKFSLRRMDCVDCHNRPSHIFRPPNRALDEAFAAGLLDSSLPYLKREAMKALAGTYTTESDARRSIAKALPDFYLTTYPKVATEKKNSIDKAVTAVQQLYSANFFPEMRTDWQAHPNHIGHLLWDGCFRCHDGLHQSSEGKVITRDCNTCHTIVAQGPAAEVTSAKLQAQPFRHPVDMGMDVTQMKCSQCHTGTTGL